LRYDRWNGFARELAIKRAIMLLGLRSKNKRGRIAGRARSNQVSTWCGTAACSDCGEIPNCSALLNAAQTRTCEYRRDGPNPDIRQPKTQAHRFRRHQSGCGGDGGCLDCRGPSLPRSVFGASRSPRARSRSISIFELQPWRKPDHVTRPYLLDRAVCVPKT
jgi:hypothetical protein